MSNRHENRRIFWMVRLLAAVGLTAIIGLIGLDGRQLRTIHTERGQLEKEQKFLYRASEEILRRASEAHEEIAVLFDENEDVPLGKSGAADKLAEVVDLLISSAKTSLSAVALKRLDTVTDRMAEIEEQALAWHVEYDILRQDVSQQQTIGRARALIVGLSNAEEMLEGQQRMQEAMQFKRWRAADGQVAAKLARTIVAEQISKQSRDAGGIDRELAEIASLAELLDGEEQLDALDDLKDNKLKPALDRISHDLADFGELRLDNGALASEEMEKLKTAFFGQGYALDQTRQTIQIGEGGLYALRRDTLLLRLDRDKLKSEWADRSHEIDVAVSDLTQSIQAQSESLAGQMEQNLASSWRRMMITGGGASVLFVWLAWLISRGIRAQVGLIERAKAEAESGRRKAQLLMQDLEKLQRNHELVLNAIGEGIHWIDCDGKILFENPASIRLLGWDSSEMLGRPAHPMMHHTRADGSEFPQADCRIYTTLRTGASQRVDSEVFWRKDGTSIPVEYVATPVRDENGGIIGAVVAFTDITRRKRAEKELQWKTALLEAQVNSSIDGILVVDQEGKKILQNRRTADLLKIPQNIAEDEDEKKQLQWVAGMARNSKQFVERVIYLNSQPNEISRDEIELTDGTILDRYSSPVLGKDGTYYGRIWTFRDITERRRVEQELKESKVAAALLEGAQRYSFLADSVPLILWTARPDGGLDYYNKAWFDYTGLTSAQAKDWGWGAVIHPDDLHRCIDRWTRSFTTGENYEIEYRFKRAADGSYRWFLGRASVRRNEEGKIVQWVGTCTDIDDQKRTYSETERRVAERTIELAKANEALQQQHAELRVLFDLMPAMICFKDTKNGFLRVNQRLATTLGKPIEEIEGKSTDEIYPEGAAKFYADDLEVIHSGAPKLGLVEMFRDREGKALWMQTERVPVCDSAGKVSGIVVLTQDITERKQSENHLEVLHKQLMESSRLAGRAEVATNVLHNVGNVLNSVNISATLVTDRVKKSRTSGLAKIVGLFRQHEQDLGTYVTSDPQGKRLPAYLSQLSAHLLAEQKTTLQELELLRENVEHIKEIVAMQQNYATFGGVKEIIDVVDLVEDSMRLNESGFNRHGVVIVREFENVPPINVEKHKILQILVNLLRNAKHACQDSDRLDKRITVQVANGDGRVKIRVADNGIGIPPENLTSIFGHGFTTRKDGHGFGLHSGALAAKEMGGSLTIESDGQGQGATCTLELPLTTNEEAKY